MGCATFCCYLLVRLQEDEMEPSSDSTPAKGFVDKLPDGRCIHIDAQSGRCLNWEQRPKTCRVYNCNDDPLLQVVMRTGFNNIAELARASTRMMIPRECYRFIPDQQDQDSNKTTD